MQQWKNISNGNYKIFCVSPIEKYSDWIAQSILEISFNSSEYFDRMCWLIQIIKSLKNFDTEYMRFACDYNQSFPVNCHCFPWIKQLIKICILIPFCQNILALYDYSWCKNETAFNLKQFKHIRKNNSTNETMTKKDKQRAQN